MCIAGFLKSKPDNCKDHIDGLVQESFNSSALAMELRLSCTNPSIYGLNIYSGVDNIVPRIVNFQSHNSRLSVSQ